MVERATRHGRETHPHSLPSVTPTLGARIREPIRLRSLCCRDGGIRAPMTDLLNVLLCWESIESHSWNPVLADLLRRTGVRVTEVHDLDEVRALDLSSFDVCLPRFRVGAAHMACVDEALVESGVPMLNSRDSRRLCENKALAHLRFETSGILQPPSFVLSAEGVRDRQVAWQGETLLKPLHGNRGSGIEICRSLPEAMELATRRSEDLLIQQMIWPARCWRIVVGRTAGVIDPYWRRPPGDGERVLSISTGSRIDRSGYSERLGEVALAMLEAVDGDILAVDILETEDAVYALEINHNFDAHGGDAPAADAFLQEIRSRLHAHRYPMRARSATPSRRPQARRVVAVSSPATRGRLPHE